MMERDVDSLSLRDPRSRLTGGRSQLAQSVLDRRAAAAATVVLVAAFGPYVDVGIRTEQLAVYFAGGLVLIGWFGRRLDPVLAAIAVLWVVLAAISALIAVTATGPQDGALASGVDALLAPAVLMLVCANWAGSVDTRLLLSRVQQWTVSLLVANSLVAVAVLQLGLVDQISGIFWSSGGPSDVLATGQYAAQQGRYGGVFNTPLAAGTAYSVGLCALVHLRAKAIWSTRTHAILAVGLLVGGLLPQSKVLLLVGLPVAAALVLVLSGTRLIQSVTAMAGVVSLGWLIARSTTWWQQYGSQSIERFFAEDLTLDLLSAGRYGTGTAVGQVQQKVLDESPVLGFGAASGLGPLDTGYVELLVRAGLVGVTLALLSGLLLVGAWISRRPGGDRAAWWTTGALLAILAGAVAGGPSITQNRSGTLLVIHLLLTLGACATPRPARDAQSPPAASPAPLRPPSERSGLKS